MKFSEVIKIYKQNKVKGFTLIEMLVVLFIITILMLLVIPNIVKHQENASKTGCDAYVDVVQTQVQAYELEKGSKPSSLSELESSGYIDSTKCSDGTQLNYDGSNVSN